MENPRIRPPISWRPPPSAHIKLNIDGCSKGNPGPAGLGGVFRDSDGNWLLGYCSNIRPCSSAMAEWIALRTGLHLAWKLGFRVIICETDALLVVTALDAEESAASPTDPACLGVIADCKELIRRQWIVRVVHTLREGNACADALSNLSLSFPPSAIHMFRQPPPWVVPLMDAILRDKLGIAVPRGFDGNVFHWKMNELLVC